MNAECPGNLACLKERCRDPCPGSCGVFTTCITIKHSPVCQCEQGYTGDPFIGCSPIPGMGEQISRNEINPFKKIFILVQPPAPIEPCNPSPCGANAICKELNGAGSCTCLPEYFGDPYLGCKPECVINSDCPKDKACIGNKCKNPCPGACGLNADCRVSNHAPSCFCLEGYTGNPAVACHVPPPRTYLHLELSLCTFSLYYLPSFRSSREKNGTLQSVTLRTVQSMQGGERGGRLLVPSELHRNPSCMPTRMHDKHRLSPGKGLREPKVRGSLSRNLRDKCPLPGGQPQPDL